MARTTTTAQAAALAATDRSEHLRVDIEDPDGNMVDVTDFLDEDFLDAVAIEESADDPIASITVRLRREIEGPNGERLSLSPLMSGSPLNRDSGDSFVPMIDTRRMIRIYTAVMLPGETPSASDWVLEREGLIDDPEFGGLQSRLTIHARDPMSRLYDLIIRDVSTYGGGSPLEPIEDVMQAILNDNFGSGEIVLHTDGDPDFGVREYDLGHVSVLDALLALRDLQGWNLHWRWNEDVSPPGFELTYWEPTRNATDLSGYAPDHVLGPDDYFDVPELRLESRGVRNDGEILYTDENGDVQTITDVRSDSVAIHGTKFLRLDERESAIRTEAQATAMLSAALDDMEGLIARQTVEAAYFWNIQLGDMVRFTPNDRLYDTNQDWGVFGLRHELAPGRMRTVLTVAGKPSGGFRRWHSREASTEPDVPDYSLTAHAVKVPAVESGVPGYYVDVIYSLGEDAPVLYLGVSTDTVTVLGNAPFFYEYSINLGAGTSGTHRITDAAQTGPFFFAAPPELHRHEGPNPLVVRAQAVLGVTGSERGGQPINVGQEDINATGSGNKLDDGSGGFLYGDKVVAGSGVSFDTDGDGRPRINATGPLTTTHTDVDFGSASMTDESILSADVTVTGAAVGDFVAVSILNPFLGTHGDVWPIAKVISADTVRVTIVNHSGATLDASEVDFVTIVFPAP